MLLLLLTMQVSFYVREDAASICESLAKRPARACAVKSQDRCVIYITPEDAKDNEIVGHEFRHCVEGDFHKEGI